MKVNMIGILSGPSSHLCFWHDNRVRWGEHVLSLKPHGTDVPD